LCGGTVASRRLCRFYSGEVLNWCSTGVWTLRSRDLERATDSPPSSLSVRNQLSVVYERVLSRGNEVGVREGSPSGGPYGWCLGLISRFRPRNKSRKSPYSDQSF
jgi:hypothetical protein